MRGGEAKLWRRILESRFCLISMGICSRKSSGIFLGYYYNDDLSLSEIAENEGITRQGVRDSIKRAEAQLFDMEERLGLRAVFMKCAEGSMKSSTARIRSASTICDMAYPGKSTIRL